MNIPAFSARHHEASTSTVATSATTPPTSGRHQTAAASERVRSEDLQAELDEANRKLAGDGSEVRFEYDREASRLIVRLVDTGTHEVLRQFPSNEALRAERLVNSGKPLIHLQA